MSRPSSQTKKFCPYCEARTKGVSRVHPRRGVRKWTCTACETNVKRGAKS